MQHTARWFFGIWLTLSLTPLDVHAQESRATDPGFDVLLASPKAHPDPYRLFPASAFDSVAR